MPTHLATENALLKEARNGNPDAFGLLVDHYRQNLYRLTLRITGNPEDAEDALQDALLNAHCNLQKFRGNSRFYTWVSRIAFNQALMSLRRRTRQVTFSSLASAHPEGAAKLEIEDCGLSPEELFANWELENVLNRALRRISPRLSSVFILRNVYGFSAMELTRMLGLSAPAVKSRLLRARTRLLKRLGKDWTSAGKPFRDSQWDFSDMHGLLYQAGIAPPRGHGGQSLAPLLAAVGDHALPVLRVQSGSAPELPRRRPPDGPAPPKTRATV